MGPSAMRVAGLRRGSRPSATRSPTAATSASRSPKPRPPEDSNAHYLKEITETCTRTAEAVLKTLEEGMTPLLLGGDHSLAAGSVSGVAEFYRRQGREDRR